jgi:hypothetical protein
MALWQQGAEISVQASGGWGEGYRKAAQKLEEVAHRAQRKHFSVEQAANWLSDPWSDLCLVVGFLLRQSSDDSRAGHHGYKCESDQNVVHARTPQQRNPDPGPVPLRFIRGTESER